MNRPRNETADDLVNENSAKVRCERAWNCQIKKMPEFAYQADWCITRFNSVHGFAEFKKRKESYENMFLSLHKWMALRRLMLTTGLPAFMVFQIGDDIFWRQYDWEMPPQKVEWGGNSRGQDGDFEPLVLLPFVEFRQLKERQWN